MVHLHNKNITHGDIKPENIFCNLSDENKHGPLLFLSDFGGGIDHSEDNIPLQLTTSAEYRLDQDDEASKKAYDENDRTSYMEIEKKADVFATCNVICSIFTNDKSYEQKPGTGNFKIKQELEIQLTAAGLTNETAKLLIQGLEVDYKKRPDAIDIFKSIQKDLALINPEKNIALLELSSKI